MKALRSILTIAAVAALVLCITAQADAQGKKKKGKGKFRGAFGTVVKCELKDDGTGTICIKTRGSKKKKTKGKEVTYKITKATKVSKRSRGGKKGKAEAARASDIKTGAFVIVRTDPDAADTATQIQIFNFGKKKKKKDAL